MLSASLLHLSSRSKQGIDRVSIGVLMCLLARTNLHKVVDCLQHNQLVVVLIHARQKVERGVPATQSRWRQRRLCAPSATCALA